MPVSLQPNPKRHQGLDIAPGPNRHNCDPHLNSLSIDYQTLHQTIMVRSGLPAQLLIDLNNTIPKYNVGAKLQYVKME
jgi:hypothetical protein